MNDFQGNELQIGDTVICSTAGNNSGSGGGLVKGTVKKFLNGRVLVVYTLKGITGPLYEATAKPFSKNVYKVPADE